MRSRDSAVAIDGLEVPLPGRLLALRHALAKALQPLEPRPALLEALLHVRVADEVRGPQARVHKVLSVVVLGPTKASAPPPTCTLTVQNLLQSFFCLGDSYDVYNKAKIKALA